MQTNLQKNLQPYMSNTRGEIWTRVISLTTALFPVPDNLIFQLLNMVSLSTRLYIFAVFPSSSGMAISGAVVGYKTGI